MPSNDFSKEERVMFEEMLEGFNDQLVLSKLVSKYRTDMQTMERAGDVIWRPQPYIMQSEDGMDQTGNFKGHTQLSVPATIGYSKSVPWIMDAKELRDATQEGNLLEAAKQRLASDVNIAIMNVAANQGTLVVPVATAASGYDDIALADAMMNEQGIAMGSRAIALSSRDYNKMAGNLAQRQTMTGKPATAYERAYVGVVAGFDTYKLDYANRIAAAGGGGSLTMNTLAAGGNYHIPKATSTATTLERGNVDNRYQRVTISSTTGVAAGDCFTIAGVFAVHHITKESTGQLKTFRVMSVDSATTMTISPPIISAQGGTTAELQYQNVEVVPSATAAIVWLNTTAAAINPFWHKDAIELLPARLAIDTANGAQLMRGSLDNNVEVAFTKFFDGNTLKTKYRTDILFGVCNKQPEMTGIMLFGQV